MRRILTLLLAALLLAALAVPASAESSTNLVLCLVDGNRPLPGAEFDVYRVGEQQQNRLVLTGAFAGYPVELNGSGEDLSTEAGTLYGFAKKDGLTPDAELRSDSNGMAATGALSPGLYLIAGKPLRYGGYLYHTEPQLILLPQKNPVTGETLRNPLLKMKFSKEPDHAQTVSRKVLKIWDDHSGRIRPASVTVHLLKDGAVFRTVTLNAANQWRYVWEGLDASALWQVTEDVPAGYTVTVEQNGNTFLLTNSAPEVPPPETTAPPESQPAVIPQTGMLWWPVAVLCALGLLLILVGGLSREQWRKLLKSLGILLMAAALLMVAKNLHQQSVAERTSREVVAELALPQETQPEQILAAAAEIPDYQRNPHMEMPERIVDGTAYIGTLEIPVLELILPVVSSTTGENLQKAPCRYSGSPYSSDLIVGAHNYEAHFGRLKNLSYGDEIRMLDLDGNTFLYRVADIEILQPEQVDALTGSGWPLTLYTCTVGGQSRVTIRCEAV